jgi:hypothetical protein
MGIRLTTLSDVTTSDVTTMVVFERVYRIHVEER